MAVDEICADETAGPAQAGFAVDGNALFAIDHVVCEADEFLD